MKNIDLSSSLNSDAGKLVARLFYGGTIGCLLTLDEYTGSPNNGPEHTLLLHLDWGDLLAFFEIIEELFSPSDFYRPGIYELKRKAGLPVYL